MNTSIAVKHALASPFYQRREHTDKLFTLPEGSVKLTGYIDDAIRFVEKHQLLDPSLWKRFVDQFRDTVPKADDANNGWRGEYWGKMMRGACFTYAYTQDSTLYECLETTVRDMMTAQDELGRISSYSVEKQYNGWDIWSRKYVLLGMQYFIEICKDSKLVSELTASMKRQVDYMRSTLGHGEGMIEITDATTHWNGLNSSSLLEPIVRLYTLTGEKEYLDFAEYIISCGGTKGQNIFELAVEGKLYPYQYNVTKAYEMMSCFEGLLEYYRVTGEEKWRTAVINLANLIADSDITVIGSAGCTHELFDHSRIRQLTTEYLGVMQETCVTVTWLKFCYQVLCLSGDVRFADEMERSIYNGMLGSINYDLHEGNGGFPFDSYSPLLFNTRLTGVGGWQVMADGSAYGCCACIGSAGTGIIPKYAAMLNASGITVNLYAPMSVSAQTPSGAPLCLELSTDYPLTGKISLRLKLERSEKLSVALRIPYWSEKTSLSVCGETINATAGSYASIERVWNDGDTVLLELDMRCKVIYPDTDEYADKNSRYHVSLRRGPLVLARDARLPGDIEEPVSFAPDAEGYVPCEPSDAADFEHFYCFAVTDASGKRIETVDYPSAGRTWDKRSLTTVWMPTKNYWSVDISSPVHIICPSIWEDDGFFYPFETAAHTIEVHKDAPAAFALKPVGNGRYLIRLVESGRYLDHDGNAVITTPNGCEWTVEKFALDRYRFTSADGLFLKGAYRTGDALTVGGEGPRPTQGFTFVLKNL